MEKTINMELLLRWYSEIVGEDAQEVTVLPQAGSSRTYVRLQGSRPLIGVYGASAEENKSFITLSKHFRQAHLPVPKVYRVSDDGHHYLQEDLGTVSLFEALAEARTSGHFTANDVSLLRKTIEWLPALQFDGDKGLDYDVCYPQATFNARSVNWDLNYFKYAYLKAVAVEFQEDRLEDDFQQLTTDLLEIGPHAFLYRDFQSRNVLLRQGEPWFIDFQGGRKGPIHYDVVSFLWQAKARIPRAIKTSLITAYLDKVEAYVPIDREKFTAQLRLFVLFRSLQVLGAYGFRGYFERKAHFLESIPFALENVQELLSEDCSLVSRYPELTATLRRIINKKIACKEKSKTETSNSRLSHQELTIQITSFSFKRGIPSDESPNGGGFVFDCRAIHNPGRYAEYKTLTGMDQPVIAFLDKEPAMASFLEQVYALVDESVNTYLRRGFDHLMVSFGCTGGQHRSVYAAEHLAAHLQQVPGVSVKLVHREQQKHS